MRVPCCPSLPCYLVACRPSPCFNNTTYSFMHSNGQAPLHSCVAGVHACVQYFHYRHRCGEGFRLRDSCRIASSGRPRETALSKQSKVGFKTRQRGRYVYDQSAGNTRRGARRRVVHHARSQILRLERRISGERACLPGHLASSRS
jgi:hypothetical protein